MAITYEWSVINLDRNADDGIVISVHYTVSAQDGVFKSGSYGSIGLEPPAEGDEIIPYADLTEEQAVEWVKNHFGAEKVAVIESALQVQIDEQRVDVKLSGTPWSPSS